MTPLPKKKHTRARKGARAAHHALTPKRLQTCPCPRGIRVLGHRACIECGHYNGRTMPGRWPSEDIVVAQTSTRPESPGPEPTPTGSVK